MAARSALTILLVLVLLSPVAAGEEALVARSISDAASTVELDRVVWFARPVWSAKPSGDGVRVAVIDTGIDVDHPDLVEHESTMLWRDFIDRRPDPYDDNGHGTHIAGIVAARGSTSLDLNRFYFPFGMHGVAPDVTLMVAKAMDSQGEGTDDTVSQAIRWATDPDGDGDTSDGADVINLSIGIERPAQGAPQAATVRSGSKTEAAIRDATSAGVVVVVSAGNDGRSDGVSEPGDMEEVIAVGATDGKGSVADFSNYGQGKPDLVSPGVIVSTYPRRLDGGHPFDQVSDGYTGMAGTSMAAPLVTGTLALMLDANPGLIPAGPGDRTDDVLDLKERLTGTAVPLGSPADGSGRLDAFAAFQQVDLGTSEVVWWFPWLVAAVVGAIALAVVVWYRRRGRVRYARD